MIQWPKQFGKYNKNYLKNEIDYIDTKRSKAYRWNLKLKTATKLKHNQKLLRGPQRKYLFSR